MNASGMPKTFTRRTLAAAGLKKIGDQLTADWLKRAGADGQAVIDAYKK